MAWEAKWKYISIVHGTTYAGKNILIDLTVIAPLAPMDK
jgi:hypothetical protein